MKRMPMLWRLLIPALLAILLLPPVSLLVFRTAAKAQAERRAGEDLADLQARAVELIEQHLSASAEGDAIRPFLRAVSRLAQTNGGDARLMLVASEGRLVFPSDEAERDAVGALAEAVLKNPEPDTVMTAAADGESYRVRVTKLPIVSDRLEYLVAYCPVSHIGAWVDGAGAIVLLLSFGVAAIAVIAVWATSQSVSRPIRTVSDAAKQISGGTFVTVDGPFFVREPEVLRESINEMSQKLQAADQAQRTFFRNISHELRTPLTSIGGYAQGIEQGVLPDPKAAARVILEESARLGELVDRLLLLSRMERKSDPIEPEPIPVSEALDGARRRILGAGMRRGVQIVIAPGSDVTVVCDAKRLALILDNLLGNAVRYAKQTVTLAAERDGESVCLSVRDDGDGIASEDLEHLFEYCYRGRGGQTGLGLTLAKTAAEDLGAALTARNDGGAVFLLMLPRETK